MTAVAMPRRRAIASPAASRRLLMTATTPAPSTSRQCSASAARSTASRLLPRPEISTTMFFIAGDCTEGASMVRAKYWKTRNKPGRNVYFCVATHSENCPSHAGVPRNSAAERARTVRADDRQLRWRAPRPSGAAGARGRGRAGARHRVGRDDVRTSSARALHARPCADAHLRVARQVRGSGGTRHRPRHRAALQPGLCRPFGRCLHRSRRAGLSRALAAGRRRFPLRRAADRRRRTAAAALGARRVRARTDADRGRRRGTHLEFRGARRAEPPAISRAHSTFWDGRTRSAGACSTAANSAARSAFPR